MRFLQIVIGIGFAFLATACTSKEKSYFVAECVGAGRESSSCECTFDKLTDQYGTKEFMLNTYGENTSDAFRADARRVTQECRK